MLHQIQPHVLKNEYTPRAPKTGDKALCFHGRELWLPDGKIPEVGQANLEAAQYLFDLDGCGYFLAEGPKEADGWQPQRVLRDFAPQELAFAAVLGAQLWRFYQRCRFCGGCGTRMRHSETERAMVCPVCGQVNYPQLSPAVIVAISHGPRLLMARKDTGDYKRWALIAGYVEAGESLEQTVIREVKEEVGLRVKEIRFRGSQPWPFSDALMLGFTARLDGDDETITLQREELAEACWFDRAEAPRPSSMVSIGATLIQAFLDGEE